MDLVGGARPNFVKLAPLHAALQRAGRLHPRIVHTGQHYDERLSQAFFDEFDLPAPWRHLGAGSGSHGAQTARVLAAYEESLVKDRPAAVVVFGDVNSTLAAALAAVKLHVPVAHVEAGLRSGDRRMPEEINRLLVDAMADRCYVTESAGVSHLHREGVPAERIHLVGNTMIDSLRTHEADIRSRKRAAALEIPAGPYAVLTMHRPSNVDEPRRLKGWMEALRFEARGIPIVFPVHPRTRAALEAQGMAGHLAPDADAGWHPVPPQAYRDHLSLLADATVVITDSGGMQEECAYLQVPCIVLRDSTERPVTVDAGICRLVGDDVTRLQQGMADARARRWSPRVAIDLWDGRAAERIADDLASWLAPERASVGPRG